jgi:hypothetical protein
MRSLIPKNGSAQLPIAREYARKPEGTLVISPDNESRRELNSLIHREMQNRGDVSKDEHKLRVLESRQEMTGADRQWAGQYEAGDVVRYSRGSKLSNSLSRESSQRTAVEVEQHPAPPKTEPVSLRGVRYSEEEQRHSLGI